MKRRAFLGVLGGCLIAPRVVAEAQPDTARIAMLLIGSSTDPPAEYAVFAKQLWDLGSDRYLVIDRRWAAEPEQFPDLIADAVRAKPAVIFAVGSDAMLAAQQATQTIPIVVITATDPSLLGIPKRQRPTANVTGLTIGQPRGMNQERLEFLKAVLPDLRRVMVLWAATSAADGGTALTEMVSAAPGLGIQLEHLDIKGSEFAEAFTVAQRAKAEAILLMDGFHTLTHRAAIGALGLRHRVPMISQFHHIADEGGLMSYGPSIPNLFRRAALLVDTLLRGARPADLRVDEARTREFVINMRTAQALAVKIPLSLIVRADRLIEA